MGNPFKAKPGSKKLNQPTSVCPLAKAEIQIEVYGYDPRNPPDRHPIEGVGLTVSGPTTTTPSTTPANGKWRYQPLNPGPYTVTPDFPSDLDERYDITGVGSDAKVLAAGESKTSVFLVPTVWVEFIVKDTANQTLPNISWQLARQPGMGGAFKQYDTGNTGADGKVFRQRVLVGTHRFTVKTLSDPRWSAAEAVIGTEIVLSALTDGFVAGDAGTIEILDGYHVGRVLETIPATVKDSAGTLRLQAKWKPAEAPFANLKHSRIMFRAKAANASVHSGPVSLLKPETVKFDDVKGKNVDRQVDFYFSGGSTKSVTTVKGTVETQIPWGETLLAVKLPALAAARVKIDAGANPGAVAV